MRENCSVAETVVLQTVRNPYDVYRKAEKKNLAGKDLEVAVLVKGARLLRECQKDLGRRLRRSSALPNLQKHANITRGSGQYSKQRPCRRTILCLPCSDVIYFSLPDLWIQKLIDALAFPSPEKLTQVININLNIAAGLRGNPEGELPFELD